MDKIIKNKRDLELMNWLLFRLKNKFRKIPSFVMYYLNKFGDVI